MDPFRLLIAMLLALLSCSCGQAMGPAGDGGSVDASIESEQCERPEGGANPFALWRVVMSPDAGPPADGGSECEPWETGSTFHAFTNVDCWGTAPVSLDGGITITLADGSTLSWIAPQVTSWRAPSLTDGELLSVVVRRRATFNINGWSTDERIELKTADGRWLWLGGAGNSNPALTATTAEQVFGVAVTTAEPTCSDVIVSLGVPAARRYRLGHVLATEPEQALPPQDVHEVQSPTGRWQVSWWASRTELLRQVYDAQPFPKTSYVISRIAP